MIIFPVDNNCYHSKDHNKHSISFPRVKDQRENSAYICHTEWSYEITVLYTRPQCYIRDRSALIFHLKLW